jgi:hypothetical protein
MIEILKLTDFPLKNQSPKTGTFPVGQQQRKPKNENEIKPDDLQTGEECWGKR